MAADNDPGERMSDLAVLEANEFKQRKRLERILDSLHSVEDKADEAWGAYVQGEINEQAKNIIIQRAVQRAVREVYKLLYDYNGDGDNDDKYWIGDGRDPIGRIHRDSRRNYVIDGLRDFLDAPLLVEDTVTETVQRDYLPPQKQQRTINQSIPEHVSWSAYLRLKEFLDEEHDLEISFEEMGDELPSWGFEEVPDEPGTEELANGDD